MGLELYILTLYVLIVAFDDVGPPGEPLVSLLRPQQSMRSIRPTGEAQPARKARGGSTESFSAIQRGTDSMMPEGALPTLVQHATTSKSVDTSSKQKRPTSAERLASWVGRRLTGRPAPDTLPTFNIHKSGGRLLNEAPSEKSAHRKTDSDGESQNQHLLGVSRPFTTIESVYSTYGGGRSGWAESFWI